MRTAGFGAPLVMSRRVIVVHDPALIQLVGPITYTSETVRAVKIPAAVLEDAEEDYGQVATYAPPAETPGAPAAFALDAATAFCPGEPRRVSGNTASLVRATPGRSLLKSYLHLLSNTRARACTCTSDRSVILWIYRDRVVRAGDTGPLCLGNGPRRPLHDLCT